MKVFVCICLCFLTTLVECQRGAPPAFPAAPEGDGEPYRPIVAARPVVEDEMSVIVAECNRRIAINASIAHYVQVPSDCSAYAACEFPDTGVEPAVVLCPAGLFFNDNMDVMACVRPVRSNCRESQGNPCAGKPDGFNQDGVRTQITQGAYYVCLNGLTLSGGWCDLGEQYLKFDQACRAIPDLPRPIPPQRDVVPCHLLPVADSSSQFMLGDSVMTCAGNTQYNAALCRCE